MDPKESDAAGEKPFSIACYAEGRGEPSITHFATLGETSAHIRERWLGPEYIDGRDGFHTDFSSYELRGFTLKDIGTMGWDEDRCRTFKFNPLPREAPKPPFFIDEISNPYELGTQAPVRHEFSSLDDAADFLHDGQKAEGIEPAGKGELWCMTYGPTKDAHGGPVTNGTKTYKIVGFELEDVGTSHTSPDGEAVWLELHIDKKQDRQITSFTDPDKKEPQFARLTADQLDTCKRAGVYLGDWNDRQYQREFGKPYVEPEAPQTPDFLKLHEAPTLGGHHGGGKELDQPPSNAEECVPIVLPTSLFSVRSGANAPAAASWRRLGSSVRGEQCASSSRHLFELPLRRRRMAFPSIAGLGLILNPAH